MIRPLTFAVLIACLCVSCQKIFEDERSYQAPNDPVDPPSSQKKKILIDASHDGGIWWFPQGSNFDASVWHQGTGLANYLKGLGYEVVELPRLTSITKDLLKDVHGLIRATQWGDYSQDEVAAYTEFLKRGKSLLIFSDHSPEMYDDKIANLVGIKFHGSYSEVLTQINKHEITTNVTSLRYIAGSVIENPNASKITTLISYNGPGTSQSAAMGIVKHPSCKIVFIGDMNGLEELPQPLTDNLFKWLF